MSLLMFNLLIITAMCDEDWLSYGVGEAAIDVEKKMKNGVQSKTTILTVVCNLSPNPEDYLLSMLK